MGLYFSPLVRYGVWEVNPQTLAATPITNIWCQHLEGALTLPNSTNYGPWAGKLITADEQSKLIYAVGTNGAVQAFGAGQGLDISADTFRLIPTNQCLYCCANSPSYDSLVLKLSAHWFQPYVGDILIVQSGEVGEGQAALYIVEWNGSSFTIPWTIFLGDHLDSSYFFEKAAFAPVDLPAAPPD